MASPETLLSVPRTIMDVFKSLPEGTLAEVINNTLYMSPAPGKSHQRILRRLFTQLDQHVSQNNLGEVFCAPFDVFLDEQSNAVQPDLLFISRTNSHVLDDYETVHGVPDLIIEILSPGNRQHDEVVKKMLYEKFGVKEYWIIDPDRLTSEGFFHENGKFNALGVYHEKINSVLLGRAFEFSELSKKA